ncbi:MAG: SCO1664 family protein [Dehalococcoidia bacterium]
MDRGSEKERSKLRTGVEPIDPERYAEICDLLRTASAESCDLVPKGSNYIFLVKLSLGNDTDCLGIYKPRKGEAPLWDFPYGTLYLREFAAYLLSEALRWHFVPPTVLWEGPHGIGSLQLFISYEPGITYFELRKTHTREVKRIAVFDTMANNTDRKGGDCIKDMHGKVWAIDHGLTFHQDYKLRTVIWDFAGGPISKDVLEDVAREHQRFDQDGGLATMLKGVLEEEEVQALADRMEALLKKPFLPQPRSRWDVPWPMV